MILLSAILAAVLAGGQAAPSSDPYADDMRICSNGHGAERVTACTALVQSGRWSGTSLAPVYRNLGVAYAEEQDFDRAVAQYGLAMAADPQSATAYLDRCIAYDRLGRSDAAMADCNQAIALKPDDSTALLMRSVLYSKQKRFELALGDLNRSIALAPNVFAFNNRGIVHEELKDYPGAIADFDAALAQRPDEAPMLGNRCRARALWGRDLDKAAQDCTRAYDLIPESGRGGIYISRAILKLRGGDNAGAIADATTAIATLPNADLAYCVRGLAETRTGGAQAAAADYARANAINPKSAAMIAELSANADQSKGTTP